MNEAIFREIRSDTVPSSMFRKRKTQHQINFKRRRRKHEIDLKPQSPLLVTRYLKNLLPQFFKHRSNICLSEGPPSLGEITRNFFARDELPIRTKSEASIPSLEAKPKRLKKSDENLTKQSLSASDFLDTRFFSLKNPLEYSVYPVHIFHYKRNASDNKHQSNPEASQGRKAEVIYERKNDDQRKCKASKHNVKTSTKGLQLYSNTSTQFEDVSKELSNLCPPQVTHKLAQYFEINPVPMTNSKWEETEEKVTNLTDYLDTKKGRSVLLNSHGKTSRKKENKERCFLCHDVNLSSDSTNKSSSNEDLRAVYKQCNKCSLDNCNCANSVANQHNMLHNDCCTSTTEMCICSAMYPKFKEWFEFNSLQFNSDFKKWQEAQKLNVFNKEHHKLINKNQPFFAMQEEDEEITELGRRSMVDKSVTIECLSGGTPFAKSNGFDKTQSSENQRYPTFIGIPIENDEPVKDVSTTERKKKKIISDASLAETIEGNTLRPTGSAPNPKTETECQIDLLKKSDFELVSDIEKMVENLISRVPSLSKSIASQSTFQKEPKPAEFWTPQEEPKPAEYWTLRKTSSKEVTPNLQLQPMNCFHLKQTQDTFQEPQTIMPLFHKRTKCKPELNESNLPKLQHVSATAVTISEPEIRTEAKLKKSAAKLSLSKLIQSRRTSESKLDSNPKKERQRISTITYIEKRDTLSPSKETQIYIKTQRDKKTDSNVNVIRSKASVSTKSSQSSSKSSVQSFIKSLLLCLKYSNSDSQVSFHDISIQCSESTRDLLLKRPSSNCILKATSSYSSDVESVENSDQLRNEETNTAVQKMVEKGTMKTSVTNSVGVQVYITTKHVKDKKTSASSLTRRRRKRKKQREASTQTYSDLFKSNLVEASSSSISLNKHKRQGHQLRHRQRSRKKKVITKKLQTGNIHPDEMAKLEKQLWNNFCNFILRFACGSFLGLSNGRRQSASAIDNAIEFNSRSSADLTLEKSNKSNHRSISIPDMSKRARNPAKPKPSKSFGDIGTCGQKLEAFPSRKNRKESFKSKELQCDEIELHLGTKHHDINAVGYHTSEESIFGMVNTKSSDSSSDSKRYGDLFKPSESLFTIAECFKASNQNHEARSPVETQSKYKIYPPPVFQLNIVNVDTKLVDPVKENLAEVAEESSEQYTFESLEDKPIDDEHVLRLRLLWLKSGLRKHRSKLSHLKIVPIRDGDELKRPSTTSEAPPSPILKKIGAKPFDFEIVKEGRRKLFEKEEESESASSESTKTERRDAFTPIAQLVNVLGDKGKERFEICAIVSVSSDSEEEGMEFAKAIESEEGMKALLKTMEVVPREIPKLKGDERIALKTSEGSEVKVDDMDMTYTSSKLMVTVPLPKKERKEQNIDCLEQLKRKLAKIFSKDVSSTGKGDIDVVYEEGRLQRKHSHVIIDTSNKAYNDRTRRDETKRKFPTFKEIVGTLPGNIRDVPKKRQKTKLPVLKGFTRTFSDKFKHAEQKIRLDSELPEASKEPIISKSDQRKCSCKQNDDDGDDREDVQEELHEFLRFERSAMRGNRRISTEMKIEEIRTKLRKVLEDDDRVKTTKHKTRGIGFKPLKEKSKIPIRRAQEKLESRSQKPHQKLNALLNRLSNKLKETNDKIKQSLETTTCKVAKRKGDRGEVDLIGLSKKLSQQDIPERKALGDFNVPPYPNGLELPKRSVSEENVPNQLRKEIETRSFSNIRNEMNSKMGEVFRRSLEIKFRGVAKRERRADLTLRKLKGIAKTIANESQTTDECVCPRGNRQEIEDASYHSQSAITGGDPPKRNFQSQLNRKVPTGRLVCDCKELKALRQMTTRLGVKSEEPRPTYKKSESFEQTPTVRPRSEKTSTAKTGPSRVECTLYKFKVDQPRQRICQIKYCGIQHSVLSGEGTFFKKVKKCVPRKLNYCGLENYGSPKVVDKRQTYLTPRKISPVLQEEPFQVKPYLSPRETSPVKVESLQEVEPVQVKHANTENVCSSVSSSCLEQIPKGKVCAGECQTRNFCRHGYYIKHVRRTPGEEERPNVEVMPTSHGSENYIHPEPEASRSDQILKGEGCSSKCQNRSTCFEKYHVGTTPRDGNPSISEGRNKTELKVNRIELRQRKLSRPEVFGSAIDLNWPKFWQTYYTSSQNNVDPEILCPKSTKLKVEEDLFAFRLSRNNSRSSLIVEETPSYLLVPVRQSQENTLYLDRKRTLKMLYPVKSETGRPSSDSSAPSSSNHSLFKSKTVHVLPNNKFSRNYLSVNSACNLESSFLCTTFDKCSSSARSVEFFNLWDAQVWNALGLCPLTLQSYYRKQLRKLLKDESETPS